MQEYNLHFLLTDFQISGSHKLVIILLEYFEKRKLYKRLVREMEEWQHDSNH